MATLSLDYQMPSRRAAVPSSLAALLIIVTLTSVAHVIYNWLWIGGFLPPVTIVRLGVLLVYGAAAVYLIVAAVRALGWIEDPEPRRLGAHLHAALLIGGGAAVLSLILVNTSRLEPPTWHKVLVDVAVGLQFVLIIATLLIAQTAGVRAALADSYGALVGDSLLRSLARDGAVAIMCMLASLIVVLAISAMPSIKAFGFKFLVGSEWRPNELEVPRRDANGDFVLEDGEQVKDIIPPAFGALPVIYGTAVSSVIAIVIAVPISLGAALFLVRIAPRIRLPKAWQGSAIGNPSWIVNGVSFLIEFLAAIPSIAYGIWGLFVLAPLLQNHLEPGIKWIYMRLPPASWSGFLWDLLVLVIGVAAAWIGSRRAVGRSVGAAVVAVAIPIVLVVLALLFGGHAARAIQAAVPGIDRGLTALLGGSPNLQWMFAEKITSGGKTIIRPLSLTGRDMFSGGMVLAIMILPIITAISRDVLRSVPQPQVEGTTALGATWWQSSWEMLRFSRSGLFGAVMLGLARAAGETMAITMVIGNNNQIRASIFAPAQTMSSLLANEFHEASSEIHRSALTEVALVLLLMSLLFNVTARYLVVGKNAPVAA